MDSLLYPLFLKLKNRKCFVIGGGKIAERKVKSLLKSDAIVTVISPTLTKNLYNLYKKNKLKWIKNKYSNSFVDEDSILIIAATDDKEVNKNVAQYCRKKKILVNVVDTPEECDFYVPSHFNKKHLQVAISTGGKNPTFAKETRLKLQKLLKNYEIPE